jgi:hypothetical protein
MISFAPHPARAEVERAAADSFALVEQAETSVSAARAIAGFGRIGAWWDGKHSYSGDACSLRLTLSAGGCFCERWAGGSVEHARVLLVIKGKTVRLKGALGPLQGMAVDAVLDFTATDSADRGKTMLKLAYLVNGSSASELDKIAPAVDGVLNDALLRLVRYLDSGKPLD